MFQKTSQKIWRLLSRCESLFNASTMDYQDVRPIAE